MRKLRLSTTTNLVPRVEDKIYEHTMANAEMAKRVGFDALDFSFCPKVFDEDRFEEYAEWGLEASERFGLKYEVCHLPFSGKVALDPSLLPALETKILKAIKGARVLGVKYAVVHPNTTTLLRREYDEEKIYESVIAHLAPIVECGEREGVNIVVENMRPVARFLPTHRYCAEPEELCRVADKLGIGICWDFGHANLAGFVQSKALEYVGSRLKMLHVNDNMGVDDDHLPPLFGTVDWKDAMHGLKLVGFDGLFNYELHTEKLPKSLRETFARHAVATAEELMNYIV